MSDIWQSVTSSAFFGIVLTASAFQVGRLVVKKTGIRALNPLVTAIVIVISFLVLFRIDYSDYNRGAQIYSFLLGPTTVALAIPVYRQVELLKKNRLLILISVSTGAVAAVVGVFILSNLFNLSPILYHSLFAKSVTAAIAIGITEQLGGIPAITLFSICLTGIFGSTLNLLVCKLVGIKERMPLGLSMGTSAHAIGTSVALEVGDVEGAMSSLALVVAGLVTVVIAPFAGMWM